MIVIARSRDSTQCLSVTLSPKTLWFLLVALLCGCVGIVHGRRQETEPPGDPSREVVLVNDSDSPVGVYWISTDTRGLSLIGNSIPPRTPYSRFNSFVGHEFEVHELPDEETGNCGGGKDADGEQICRVGWFTVNTFKHQVIRIKANFEVDHDVSANYPTPDEEILEPSKEEDGSVEPKRTPVPLHTCREEAVDAINSGVLGGVIPSDIAIDALSELVSCVRTNVTRELQDVNEEITFQKESRVAIATQLENYTCADETYPPSVPLETTKWADKNDVEREVDILHNRDASKIHIVKDFISEAECEAMENAARPLLHKATVADGKGGSELSKNRKAMQAGITVPWSKEKKGNPIARLSRRVYDYTNHVLGLSIDEFGQEDLMSIQYFGRGDDDPEPDRYTPHCDGDCTGMKHKSGTRMATMVMYCKIPIRGGKTNFKNAGVTVKPAEGNSVFFSYIGSDKTMDTGFTEHSGCPVIEGEKKIVTQWIRLGVDSENPWDSFNTLGVQVKDEN